MGGSYRTIRSVEYDWAGTMSYKHGEPLRSDCNIYKVFFIIFLGIAIFSTLVAVHNAQPMTCDSVRYDEVTNRTICEKAIGKSEPHGAPLVLDEALDNKGLEVIQ